MLRSVLIFVFFMSLFSAFLLGGCNGPGVNAYYRGNEAFQCGHYHESFVNYLYAANQDVVPAQYALGYQYFYGLGTKRDEPKGILWLQRAAHHSLRAQYALHLIQSGAPVQPWVFQLKKSYQK